MPHTMTELSQRARTTSDSDGYGPDAAELRPTPSTGDLDLADRGSLRRVVERGVGETRSCGTGACAAAYAALVADGRTEGTVQVDVPGGRLTVQVTPGTTVLTGPAVIVAAGTLYPEWLAG